MRGAESDSRTYLVSPGNNFLARRDSSIKTLDAKIEELGKLTADNPYQQNNVKELHMLVLEEIDLNNSLLKNKVGDPSNPAILQRATSISDSASAKIESMRGVEEKLLKLRIQENQNVSLRTLLTNGFSMVLAFSALLVLLLQIDHDYVIRRRSQQNMQAFLGSTKEGFYMIDRGFKIEVINQKAIDLLLEVYGLNVKHGQSILQIIVPERRDYIMDIFQKVLDGQAIEYESAMTIHGTERWFHTNYAPVKTDDHEVVGISVVFRDITDTVHNRQGLISGRNKAEAAEKSQEEFLANMSHEIRTPMNGIIGMTELLQKTKLDQQQQEFLGVIEISADHLMELINDILDFSKIKSGKISLDPVDFNLQDTIRNNLSALKVRAKQKGLEIFVDVAPETPAWLYGDPQRLGQIIINLVSNAIKFTAEGSVTLRVSRVQIPGDDLLVQFTVIDTGIGIEKENMQKIFESFMQAEEDTAKKFGGTGLGLTISKKLIELQGGSISVKSEPGKGSEFAFTIPYGRVAGSARKEQRTEITMEPFPGTRVMIVEDNVMNQLVLKQYLRNLEVETETVNNGKQAIELLEEEKNYDCIILDLRMPVMDGFETAEWIRNKLHLDIPIIAFTASALRSEKDKCIELGMNEYLTKPFKGEDLYIQLRKYLAKKKKD
jgi:PAS domain S-box-containing protein